MVYRSTETGLYCWTLISNEQQLIAMHTNRNENILNFGPYALIVDPDRVSQEIGIYALLRMVVPIVPITIYA